MAKKKKSTGVSKFPKYEIVLKKHVRQAKLDRMSRKTGGFTRHNKKATVIKRFVVKKGEELRTVKDALHSLQRMSEDIFKHHLIDFKNEFSDWFQDVFNKKNILKEIKDLEKSFVKHKGVIKKVFNKLEKMRVK